ncbi:MAG: hypothetical protein ABJ004_16755 [Cyclobacteriaceae bacterium]
MKSILEDLQQEELLGQEEYSKTYSSVKVRHHHKYGEIPSVHTLEKNLMYVAMHSTYESLKSSMQKDFQEKLMNQQEKYESLMTEFILKSLDSVNTDLESLNSQLRSTIDTISTKTK